MHQVNLLPQHHTTYVYLCGSVRWTTRSPRDAHIIHIIWYEKAAAQYDRDWRVGMFDITAVVFWYRVGCCWALGRNKRFYCDADRRILVIRVSMWVKMECSQLSKVIWYEFNILSKYGAKQSTYMAISLCGCSCSVVANVRTKHWSTHQQYQPTDHNTHTLIIPLIFAIQCLQCGHKPGLAPKLFSSFQPSSLRIHRRRCKRFPKPPKLSTRSSEYKCGLADGDLLTRSYWLIEWGTNIFARARFS